jgi:hypothetical protein
VIRQYDGLMTAADRRSGFMTQIFESHKAVTIVG